MTGRLRSALLGSALLLAACVHVPVHDRAVPAAAVTPPGAPRPAPALVAVTPEPEPDPEPEAAPEPTRPPPVLDANGSAPSVQDDGLLPIQRCQIRMHGKIYFATAKAKIKRRSFATLDAIAKTILAYPQLTFAVHTHNDSRGSPRFRRTRITQRRAESVRDYLIERGGIESSRLQAVGYGENKPIADNRTEEGRALNRRTEVWVQDCEEWSAPKPAGEASPG